MTASRIARKLQTEPELAELKLPTVQQIQNQKAYRARQRGFINTLSIEDLQEYYNQHKAIPDDEDESFVVAFKERTIFTNESGEMKVVTQFIIVFSTVRLLPRQAFWPVMQVDGTYKLMTLNYPLLVCGFSDADKRFFPTGAAISSHEGKWSYGQFMHTISRWDPVRLYEPRILIADGAPPITSEKNFHRLEGECVGSMSVKILKMNSRRQRSTRMNEVTEDVKLLARATCYKEFYAAARTLLIHWDAKWSGQTRIMQALQKFSGSWLLRGDYHGWFYRFAASLGLAMASIEEHIWLIGSKNYKGTAEGLRPMWEELEQATRLSDRRFSYTSWTRYKELRNSFYSLKKSSCYAGYISCTCPEGIMDVVCKHSLMLMEAEKLIDPLPQPLEGRQKRGRKRKIGHALERD